MINKFIINGIGGSGKDTFVKIFTSKTKNNVYNVSSIDTVEDMARHGGWNGEKSNKARKFLSDLKALSIEYNDFPTDYVIRNIEAMAPDEYMFIHIREASEIEKVLKKYPDVVTILIDRNVRLKGNKSDDNVYDYKYDYVIDNKGTLDDLNKAVELFMNNINAE